MPIPSPTSSDKAYWGEEDDSWLAAVSPSMLAGDHQPVGASASGDAFRTPPGSPRADPRYELQDAPESAARVSERRALHQLDDWSSLADHELDNLTLPNALADESFVDREIEVAFNNLGKVKQEMHKFYDRTRVQARLGNGWIARVPMAIGWILKAQPARPRQVPDRSLTLWGFPVMSVVCYGTVIDVLYQEEMVYMKMKDPTGECVLRIIRTHHNVEPQMEHGALPGIAVGVSISVLAIVLLNHSFGSHDFMLVTPGCPWIVESSSITQHIRYAEIFRDFTMRVRSERRTKFISTILAKTNSVNSIWSALWDVREPCEGIDPAMLKRVKDIMKGTLKRARVGRPAAGCTVPRACRLAMAELTKSAVVDSKYISLAIEEGLLEGWVTEDVLESKALSWAYISS